MAFTINAVINVSELLSVEPTLTKKDLISLSYWEIRKKTTELAIKYYKNKLNISANEYFIIDGYAADLNGYDENEDDFQFGWLEDSRVKHHIGKLFTSLKKEAINMIGSKKTPIGIYIDEILIDSIYSENTLKAFELINNQVNSFSPYIFFDNEKNKLCNVPTEEEQQIMYKFYKEYLIIPIMFRPLFYYKETQH